jgi:hypothetical protein
VRGGATFPKPTFPGASQEPNMMSELKKEILCCDSIDHLFMTIQSFNSIKLYETNTPDFYDFIIAAEMRLPQAIDRKLLSPFQYFAVSDMVDPSQLTCSRGGYNIAELENDYTSSDIRVKGIISSLYKYVTDINEVIGLGFCVSVEHARQI